MGGEKFTNHTHLNQKVQKLWICSTPPHPTWAHPPSHLLSPSQGLGPRSPGPGRQGARGLPGCK